MLITSRENPLIKEAAALVRDKKARRETGLFVAEGARACFEAVKSSAEVLRLFVTEEAEKERILRFFQNPAGFQPFGKRQKSLEGILFRLFFRKHRR